MFNLEALDTLVYLMSQVQPSHSLMKGQAFQQGVEDILLHFYVLQHWHIEDPLDVWNKKGEQREDGGNGLVGG